MRMVDIEQESIDLMGEEEYIDEDLLVDNDDLEAFTAAFNRGERLA